MARGKADRDKPIGDVGLAFRRFFTTLFGGRCPNCAEGRIGRGFFNIKDTCDVCKVKFERGDFGNWMVASTINYFLTAIICVLVTLYLVRTYGFFDGLAVVVCVLALLLIVLLYRPAKLLAVWLLWLFGFIYAG